MPKRDWSKDWEVCERATPGPWYAIPHPEYKHGNWRVDTRPDVPHANFGQLAYMSAENAQFVAEAREGWPAALEERARLAKRVQELEEDITFLTQEYGNSNEPMTQDALELKKRCRILEERARLAERVRELEAENRRLQKALRKIAFPIVVLQEEAEEVGAVIDGGAAAYLSNDAAWLKDIAMQALEGGER